MLYLIVPLAVLVAIIWALVAFPSFRVVVLILVALGAVAYFSMSEKAAQEQKEQAARKTQDDERRRVKFEAEQRDYCQAEQKRWAIVPPGQIELRTPTLTQDQFYGSVNSDFTLAASAKNKSKLKVTAWD